MKNNKLFWPVVILALIVVVEGVIFLGRTGNKSVVTTKEMEVEQVVAEEAVMNFGWKEGEGMRTLTVTSMKELALDGMDLYVDFVGAKDIVVKEKGKQGNMIYSGVDKDKSRVVIKYYVKATDGLKLMAGETVELLDINYQPIEGQKATFSINPSTLVVENGTVKTLPYL